MEPVKAPPLGAARVVTVVREVEGVGAERFLREAEGSPRGFWARGGRWFAHLGAAALVDVGPGEGDRFHRVAARARALGRSVEPGADEEPLRLYGGFSFRSDHRAEGVWSAYPAARFVLPAVELEGGGPVGLLRGRAPVGPDDDAPGVRRLLEDRLDALAARLTGGGGQAAAGNGNEAPASSPPSPAGSPVPPDAPPRDGSSSRGDRAPVPATRTATDRAAWERAVEEALEEIRQSRVSKVVLARTLDVTTGAPLDPVRVVLALLEDNQGTHVFLFEPEPGTALVGAAPETVATLRGTAFHATAVAGSIGRGESPAETEALAERLLGSGKDRREHAFALDDMVARLRTFTDDVTSEAGPHVLTLSRIQHLETRIEARMPEGVGVLEVLGTLHPTPAVCGLPRDAALHLVHREEPFERGWYAGPVGWFDLEGDGVFAPALRSAVVRDRSWRLFAGAGIVSESVPSLEWEETRIKFEPILRALEASGARFPPE